MILDGTKPLEPNLPVGPVKDQSLVCGLCNSGPVSGVRVLPLSFEPLEKSVKLRLAATQHSSRSPKHSPVLTQVPGQKRSREEEQSEREIETAQVVFSMGMQALATNSSDSENRRTGRWGDEEIAFVDYLMKSFDHGQLPIPHGMKLSTFLGDLLMCKASRLTKKMKNAKLGARSYELVAPSPDSTTTSRTDFQHDGVAVNKLQRDFIESQATEYYQLETGFHLSRQWRTIFSDLCLQVGYPFLDASMYLSSLEAYERRASLAEERMRNVRRKRMGFSIQSDESSRPSSSSRSSVGVGTRIPSLEPNAPAPTGGMLAVDSGSSQFGKFDDVLPEKGVPFMEGAPGDSTSADHLDNSLTNFIDPSSESGGATEEEVSYDIPGISFGKFDVYSPAFRQSRGDPFLEAIAMYLEQRSLPFQHADVWVPSYVDGSDNEVHLLHAGYVTRRDQDDKVWSAFENFGEYSKGFTCTPGVGLVGRVYSSGKTLWESNVNELNNPKVFLRAGGAKEYSVRTATGIPFSTPGVGRMVVFLYSCNHVQEDTAMARQCAEEFSGYLPEPKWKLVIEMGDQAESLPRVAFGEGEARSIPQAGTRSTALLGDGLTKALTKKFSPGKDSSSGDVTVLEEIIALFGEQLALLNRSHSLSDESSQTSVDSALFHEFMSIRLTLLRPEHRRSTEENEVIELLKCSYKAYYAGGSVRNGDELATLLAREWQCLNARAQSSLVSISCSSVDQHSSIEEDHADHHDVVKPSTKPLGSQHNDGTVSPSIQLLSTHHGLEPPIKATDKNNVENDHSAGLQRTSDWVVLSNQSAHTPPTCVGLMRRTVSSSTLNQLQQGLPGASASTESLKA
eukprot:Nitzschia sp. Nitz4//scaffold110_size71422//10119//12662//NITZ4_005864-RA/size71422-processed-gene-0.54-mRNA-1//1//CDS//3329533059//8079//frame0